MYLSKALDTLNHNLLVAKFKANGLNSSAALFIKSYLTNRYQIAKLVTHLVNGKELKLEYHKDLSLDPYFLTSS